jgi:hypothetical protein
MIALSTCLALLTLPLLPLAATVSTVYQFPPGTWVENIAVRSNGNLLVVLFNRPEVHEINTFATPPTAQLVADFDEFSGIQGIAEVLEGSDEFAVLPRKGSQYSSWTVNLSSEGKGAKTERMANIQGVGMLNGLTRLSSQILLASDTSRGQITLLDVRAGTSTVAVEDQTMMGIPFVGAGINGIRVMNNHAYWTNSYKGTLNRVPVHPIQGTKTGPVQTIASGLKILDDLAVHENGTAYVMQYLDGSIVRVDPDGSKEVVATGLNYPTSAQFGRTERDRNVLYVSSGGNPLAQIPGVMGWFDGGSVYAVDLS